MGLPKSELSSTSEIKIIRGTYPASHEKEFSEMQHYESGDADFDASKIQGNHEESWLNVIHAMEPASIPSAELLLSHPHWSQYVRGKVLELGAGTCWLSAKMSQKKDVDEVFCLDLSESFLCNTGLRVFRIFKGHEDKLRFVISDFNHLPFEDSSMDCVVLFACLHHSLSPIKTLQEAGRVLRPGGRIVILEQPHSVLSIRSSRKQFLSESAIVTEIAYTKDELEYVIDNAQVGTCTQYPLDVISSRRFDKWMVRKLLRALNLEHVVSCPPHFFFIEK